MPSSSPDHPHHPPQDKAHAAPPVQRLGGPEVRQGVVQPIAPLTVASGRVVFVSGQVPMKDGRPDGQDIAAQTHAVIDRIEALLSEVGVGLDRVAKVTVWLTDRADYEGFNAAYAQRFGAQPPARSTVISQLLPPVKIEMEAVAVLDVDAR